MNGQNRIPFLLAAFFLPQNQESESTRPLRSQTARRYLRTRRAPRVFGRTPFRIMRTRERLLLQRRQRLQNRSMHGSRRLRHRPMT
jgi:hypothetical protein